MAKTTIVDSQQGIRVVDAEVNKNLGTRGAENFDKSDFLKITLNDTALASGVRNVKLEATNADDTVGPHACISLAGKGTSGLLFIPQLAASPTHAAWMKGAMYFNSTDGKFYGNNGSAWVVIGAQS